MTLRKLSVVLPLLLLMATCGDDGGGKKGDAPADLAVDSPVDVGPERMETAGLPCGAGVTCGSGEECCVDMGMTCPMEPDGGSTDAEMSDGGSGDGGSCTPVMASAACKPTGMCAGPTISCFTPNDCPAPLGCCLSGGFTCKAESACTGQFVCTTPADCYPSAQYCCPLMGSMGFLNVCQANACGTVPDAAVVADGPPRETVSSGPTAPPGVYGPCGAACGSDSCVMGQAYGGTGSFCTKGCTPGAAGQCPAATGVTGEGICVVNACVLRCQSDADCYGGAFCEMGAPSIGKVCAY